MMECQTCNGMRFVSRKERKKWYQNGTWCYMGNQTQTVTEICADCNGTGLALNPAHNPDCTMCHGTGERNAWDSHGEWEVEPCVCENPALAGSGIKLIADNSHVTNLHSDIKLIGEKPANPIEAELLARLEVS